MPAAPRTPARSAGVLVFRRSPVPAVLLGHMGGPFWARKHEGGWSVPKGLVETEESPEEAARREFEEETGLAVPEGRWHPLGEVRTSGGKLVALWAVEGTVDPSAFTPGTFELEWPPRSGTRISVPEIDQLRWWTLDEAETLLTTSQRPFVQRLRGLLAALAR
jgi:predicted NUDIX family NTP pyrophosphohydrolase